MLVKTGLGQDSHAFENKPSEKRLILGGVCFDDCPALAGNSDADVVLHAVTNAVSGVTGVNILGEVADRLCLDEGITDSRVYLAEALKYLDGFVPSHLSISIECRRPRITPRIPEMKAALAELLGLPVRDIGITATSGEGLTPFGKGEGIQVLALITAVKEAG